MQIEEALNQITAAFIQTANRENNIVWYGKYVIERPDRIAKISKHKMKDIGVIHFVGTKFLGFNLIQQAEF